ncbi:lipase 3-like [Zerene cesonia]|uniref:lipase 3-like n=1 Tax=Zerene cesonia TaxID=33412 RepID=UPI0018E55ADA|nr:lipase 3-like [Zerene cesonia]
MKFLYVIYYVFCSSLLSLSNFVMCDINTSENGTNSDNKSEIYLDSLGLIRKYNYPAEVHPVITDDGYLLNLFRIPGQGPPILLVHGVGDSSDSWLVLGPESSLAFLLANAGFDVWLFNARGNRYSKTNMNMVSNKRFWNFSFEEMGTHDLPATIDYILNKTFRPKLTYIGYSQGTTTFFIMCSSKPEYNEKINHAVLLAPVTWLTHTKYPLMKFWAQIVNKLMNFSESAKVYEVFSFNKKIRDYHASVCNIKSVYNFLCYAEYYSGFGLKNLIDLIPERLPVITSHIPAGVSVKTFFHFIQIYASKRFQRYDYGFERNKEMYSSVKPPEYNVSMISVPITLFVSEVDWFGDTEDVNILKSKLNSIEQVVAIGKSIEFSHLEFVYGARVNNYINEPVINILKAMFIR